LREAAERGEFAALTDPAEDEDLAAPEADWYSGATSAVNVIPGCANGRSRRWSGPGSHCFCEAGGFNFERIYGDRGRGFIECHHVVPLHVAGTRVNSTADLALLCANCHRMIHRSPWLSPAELRAMIASLKGS
jgi:5-methylcytosine-specific restriction protein A